MEKDSAESVLGEWLKTGFILKVRHGTEFKWILIFIMFFIFFFAGEPDMRDGLIRFLDCYGNRSACAMG